MLAIRFTNALNQDQILNLDSVSAVEKPNAQKSLMFYYGKEHMTINFKTIEDRDEVYDRICKLCDL